MIATVIGIPAIGIAYAGGARMLGSSAPAKSASRSPALVENCNRFAAQARDDMRIAKNGAVGGVVGAGVGAASGAIADGGKGAGKGAGIGALVGITAGALYGLNEENRESDAARDAYAACIARGGQ